MKFTKATEHTPFLRLALTGPAGSGKTWTALQIATALSTKVAVVDTEHGSAAKFNDAFTFDVVQPHEFSPRMYSAAITAAEKAGYEVLIIDSLSHAWNGKGGALEMADNEKARQRNPNSFSAWRNVTPVWQEMIEHILSTPMHVIATMRAKTEYIVEKDERGKSVPRKVGLAPIIRDGTEYEFDILGELTPDHQLLISKTRCRPLDGAVLTNPGEELADHLKRWLNRSQPQPVQGTVQTINAEPKRSITLEIEQLGRELYHDMWEEKAEEIASWASGHRTKSVANLSNEEKARVLAGMQEKLKKAA